MINPKPILAMAVSALLGALAMTDWRSVYGKQGIKPAEKPSEHIVNICQLHHRLLAAYPAQKPTTFFQHLGLDHSEAPFTDPRWLMPGEAAYDKAHDAINKNRAAEAMQDHQLMAVYMDQFMPELVKSQGGVKWLKKTCGKDWKEEN
ncbi:hypothetical protein CEP53_001138 [Fusarium sp. AF-6]|nr:hypothetical protein CEP53_001138 [Fusarium sp. AF-6]